MNTCSKCNDKFTDGVKCSVCNNSYDFPCSGITEVGYRKLGQERQKSWRCFMCSSSSKAPTNLEIMEQLHIITKKLAPLDALVADVEALKESVAGNIKHISEIDLRVSKLEKSANLLPSLKADISRIDQGISDREQRSRLNNVEIKGVPFNKNENIFDIIQKIASHCKVHITESQFSFYSRVQSRSKDVEKPIIACFVNRYVKDNFVAAVRACKGINASDLGYGNLSSKIYVNDHLTADNKMLLNKAKSLANEINEAGEKKCKYVWVKHCRIYVRKNDNSELILIRGENDLKKIR